MATEKNYFSIVDSNRKAKLEEERLKKVFEEENKVIMNIVTPVAEFYKLTDIKYDHLEVNSLNGIVYLKTDKYDWLQADNHSRHPETEAMTALRSDSDKRILCAAPSGFPR